MIGRIFLSQEEIHVTIRICLPLKEISVTWRKVLSQEGNSCYMKDIPVPGRNFLSQVGNSWHRKGILVPEGISCRTKFILFKRKTFIWQKGNSCYRKEIPIRGRKFLLQEQHSCYRNNLSCYTNNIHVTGMKFLLKNGYLWYRNSFMEGYSSYRGKIKLKKRNSWYRREIPWMYFMSKREISGGGMNFLLQEGYSLGILSWTFLLQKNKFYIAYWTRSKSMKRKYLPMGFCIDKYPSECCNE